MRKLLNMYVQAFQMWIFRIKYFKDFIYKIIQLEVFILIKLLKQNA